MKLNSLRIGAVLAICIVSAGLAACNSTLLEPDTIDYRSATQRPTLVIPPDLIQIEGSENYMVSGGSASYEDYMAQQNTQPTTTSTGWGNAIGDVTMKRDGNRRWLVVERGPEEIWSELEAFWQDIGFMLVLDEPKLGIMETDWAENRAKIPQDFIRRSLGVIFDGLYSTGERDKFRTRVEVTAEGTEIFITHRGVEEVYSDTQRTSTVWQPRPADAELEAEMLRRVMLRLGVTEDASHRAVQEAQVSSGRAQMITHANQPAVRFAGDFDTTWRWVGISLDRISFTVVDRDAKKGIYQVRYVDPVTDTISNEPGLLSGLFGGGNRDQNLSHDYQIKLLALEGEEGQTIVQVLSSQGAEVDSKVSSRILGALAKDLN